MIWRRRALLGCLVLSSACSPAPAPETPDLPQWSYDASTIFPADRSLARAEDGVALRDGRLLVADQVHGLRLISPDGTTRPFGTMPDAGYTHTPPALPGCANGVSLEPDAAHVLVSDVCGGGIYRVNVADESTARVYRHAHGVNAVVRDRTGAIWFTQSTENALDNPEATLFRSVDVPTPDGVLLRLAPSADSALGVADRIVEGLYFANGLVVDGSAGRLYVAETNRDRVLSFAVDLASGQVTDRRVLATIPTPDNLELDETGRLWVASPLTNQVFIVEPGSGRVHSAFHAATAENDRAAAEWVRRGAAGEPRLDLMAPSTFAPLPGFVTGVILSPTGGDVYLTGLSDTLVRLKAR